MADNPITRKEKYLAKLTGSYTGNVPDPITRVEKYLYDLCQKGISGLTPEEIENAVNKYLKENPVQPGATTEQAQQIKQNTDDVASLKEDISNKITKFYASSQGEIHLDDSDNGKIMDMMLYGRSEQKQYSGKNLLNATLQTTTQNGVTCTANNDGTFTLNGTATASFVFIIIKNDDLKKAFGTNEELRLTGTPKGASKAGYYLQIWKNEPEVIYCDTGEGVTAKKPNASCNVAIVIVNGVVCNNVLFKPMLTTDLTATYDDFEPYTGGIPSPNPDYPQEIKSVVNPTMKVCGKNLLNYKETIINGPDVAGIEFVENGFRIYTKKDINYCSSKTYLDFSKLRIGETYTLSANLLIVKGVSRLTIRNRANTIIADSSNITESGTYKISFTLTDQMYYVSFFATFDAAVSGDVIVTNIQLEKNATPTAYEPYHEQTITLPYTLNAIPVNSGGNVTIDGQQYVADYVDVERGKLVKMVDSSKLDNTQSIVNKTEWLLAEPQEIDLTTEEITAFKALATYYPVTNISVNSEQLDGYTVFNYPISMENGWNYVKQQIGDTRDYIYDMDARTQDTDLQAAEAYVNSEYAVALTELEV